MKTKKNEQIPTQICMTRTGEWKRAKERKNTHNKSVAYTKRQIPQYNGDCVAFGPSNDTQRNAVSGSR